MWGNAGWALVYERAMYVGDSRVNLKMSNPIVIYEDNNGCISIATIPQIINNESISM